MNLKFQRPNSILEVNKIMDVEVIDLGLEWNFKGSIDLLDLLVAKTIVAQLQYGLQS